ncbi:MAG TPA: response regulator [Ktedonobacterales bacterium]
MSTNFDKFAILDSFLDEVATYLPEVSANLDRLQQRPDDQEALEETYRRAHTIAGSAAMMDFTALAHVAQGIEETLGDALDGVRRLDIPAIGLLRRSFSRLSRLADLVRSGADGNDIAAEDDADRAAWRGGAASAPTDAAGALPSGPAGGPMASPGLPDWLAGFGPATTGGPAPQQSAPNGAPHNAQPSFDDMLQAFGASPAGPASMPAPGMSGSGMAGPGMSAPGMPTPTMPPRGPVNGFGGPGRLGGDAAVERTAPVPAAGMFPPRSLPSGALGAHGQSFPSNGAGHPVAPADAAANLMAVSPAWEDLHANEDAVRRQVAALRDVVATLREAAQTMEDERTELRGFLDGSRDALERLEDWAGQAMGLDLRRSPEQVRRYLPLSVIWVTTTRLKKLVALLNNSGRNVTAKQEEIQEALTDLHGAVENVGRLFSSVAAVASSAVPGGADGGFTATVAQVAQVTWNPAAARPAGDSGVVAAPPAPTVGAEPPQLPPGARAELERDVREELRRELEDDVRAEVAAEVRRDEEDRLRQELEIQVRRKVLADLTPGVAMGGTGAPIAITGSPTAVTAAISALATGAPMPSAGPLGALSVMSAPSAPQPVRITEQNAETMAVFREEAEEHLQNIALGLRQLERNPHDRESLQAVRRATHTLKGAAGMMGFAQVQQLAHASEDLLDRLMDGSVVFTPVLLGLLLDASEALERLVAGTAGGPQEEERQVAQLQARFASALGMPVPPTSPTGTVLPTFGGTAALAGLAAADAAEGDDADAGSADADLTVRLRLSKLDELVNLFGELLQNRSVLEERITRMARMAADTTVVSQRLSEVGTQLESRFEATMLASGRRGESAAPANSSSLGASGGLGTGAIRGGAVRDFGRGAAAGSNRPGREHIGEFDELELDRYTEFHRLSRGLSESVTDMGTLSNEMEQLVHEVETVFARENRLSSGFQDQLMKARLVPLQSLVPRLYRAIRAAALKQGKEVDFFVEGGDTEVDRTVYEEVAGPLSHLVRNSVVHGIEPPDVRQRLGKTPTGRIVLSAANQGNQVIITVRDDGSGVDPASVRASAVARGLVDPHATLSQQDALNLIFQPGLSTSRTIDQESGRGVGLDVVRDAAARLRGTVEVESQRGQGTFFTLRIPVSLQITRAVLVRAGDQTFAIPMNAVEQIGRLDYYERVRAGGPPAIEVRGVVYPLAHLASYLHVRPGTVDDRSSILLVNTGRQRMALIVDQIQGRQEVVAKNLGPHLREVRGIAGATVLGNGQVVLILNLAEVLSVPPAADAIIPNIPSPTGNVPRLSASATGPAVGTGPLNPAALGDAAGRSTGAPRAGTGGPQPFVVAARPSDRKESSGRVAAVKLSGSPSKLSGAPRRITGGTDRLSAGPSPAARTGYVLVVDDSPSVRRVVGNMLKANGWEVQTARDGVEALDVVAKDTPAAVLLDIEMPRMDGYELMATLRSQPQYRNLPLVVLTSRAATKHQQRALQLGADAYVVKPYQDEELLRTIDGLVARHAS